MMWSSSSRSVLAIAVADDAEDPAIEPVEAGGLGEAGSNRKALAERTGGGIEHRHAFHRVGMAVEGRIDLAERGEILDGHRTTVVRIGPEVDAQVAAAA